jgi:hypothetical protein
MRNVRWMMTAALLLAVVSGCDRGGGGGASKGGGDQAAAPGDSGPPPGQLPQGTQLGPSIVDATWSQGSGSFEEITRVVTEGAPATEEFGVPMPPKGNGSMTDAQIRAVSAYAYSLARRGGQ